MSETSSKDADRSAVDPDRARASIERLMAIYRDIARAADQMALVRCPYKNARSRCTAQFGCRNQRFIPGRPDESPICAGSDKLDYRKAWES